MMTSSTFKVRYLVVIVATWNDDVIDIKGQVLDFVVNWETWNNDVIG